MKEKRLALVTGGNRGLGLGTCRELAQAGYQVILASRDEEKGRIKAQELNRGGLSVEAMLLDISNSDSIASLHRQIEQRWGRLDVLVNNAAILIDKDDAHQAEEDAFKQRRRVLEETLNVNVAGAYDLCNRFVPLMLKNGYGRIVNVSSGLGQLSDPHSNFAAYSISKTALNMVTCIFAAQTKGSNVLVNSVCPGWVKTDMGGEQAPRSIEEGISGIVWASTLPDHGPSGGFFRDGKPIDW
ncbi:SDR family oxidoreductase [Candidatus Protochlamydia phocaeensis]|uniref:SDR family oxidoreductase n=1 Tax=Candidatus Protochlamydia phocaeensis TaxID=1414722 RepID=UPI000838B78A|nr:SDR family oxidoreductase [Candidatus Protochlamydia phocaeensis]